MKVKVFLLFTRAIITSVFAQTASAVDHKDPFSAAVRFEIIGGSEGPVIKQGDPGTEDNKYGFEGGTAFKFHGMYHLFTAERFGDPILVKMRLAHWKSADGLSWERVSTLFESSGNFTGEDTHASIWSPMPFFNEDEGRWNLFYVAYRSKPNSDEGWFLNYDGRIQRAVSQTPGVDGLNGPYTDANVVLQPDADSEPWEGLQGVDSFYIYKAAGCWYGFYGSAQTQAVRNEKYPKWCVGLAVASAMNGPWIRYPDLNPVIMDSKFAENPVVTRMNDGLYVAMVDGGNRCGYVTSTDGLHWSQAEFLPMNQRLTRWWTVLRTPLGLIPEEDGTYTIFYTAYTKSDFASVGMMRLKKAE